MRSSTPAPVLSILSHLVEDRSGMHYRDHDLELLAEKIQPRAQEAGFDSLLDYYYFLRYDPKGAVELDALIETLVVGETYFFRELEPLRVLIDQLLRPRIESHGRVRIWSAACATGEEPLTLAMLLDERGLLGRVEIVASDLSTRSLAAARRGRYSGRALRALPPGVAGRWMDVDDRQATVRQALRDAIDWRQVNLTDDAAVASLGVFDAVLCRNVLIYFSDETTLSVVKRLSAALRPGGCLVIGVSESLLRFGTSLRCEEHGGAFFYCAPR